MSDTRTGLQDTLATGSGSGRRFTLAFLLLAGVAAWLSQWLLVVAVLALAAESAATGYQNDRLRKVTALTSAIFMLFYFMWIWQLVTA